MKRFRFDENGQDLIEYALVAPLFFLLVFAIVEAGVLLLAYGSVANAAREGARAAIVPPGAACDITCLDERAATAALQSTIGLDPAALTITVNRTATTLGVNVNYVAPLLTAPVITALGGTDSVTIQATAVMNTE